MSLLALLVTGAGLSGVRSAGAQSPAAAQSQATSARPDRATAIDRLAGAYHSHRRFNGTLLVADSGRIIYQGAFGHADLEADRANGIDTRFPVGWFREPRVEPADPVDSSASGERPDPDHSATEHALGYERTLSGYRPAAPLLPGEPPGISFATAEELFRWTSGLRGRDAPAEPAALERRSGLGADRYGRRVERWTGAGGSETYFQHEESLPGYASAWRHLPRTDATIVALDNASSSLGALLDGITALLRGGEPALPKPSIAERILPVVEAAGVDAGLQRYVDRLRFRPDDYDFGPGELAALGDHFLERGDTDTAIRLHAANVEWHPDHPLPYRGSAEAHLAAGDTTRAVALFEDALMRAPGDPESLRSLRHLGAEVEPALAMPVRPLAAEALARFAGVYQIEPGAELEVVLEADGLVARRAGGAPFPLLPQAEGVFLMHGSRIQLVFAAPTDGARAPADAVTVIESGQRVTFPRVR